MGSLSSAHRPWHLIAWAVAMCDSRRSASGAVGRDQKGRDDLGGAVGVGGRLLGRALVAARAAAQDGAAHEGRAAHRAVVGAAHRVAHARVDAPKAHVRRDVHRGLHERGLAEEREELRFVPQR